MNITTNGTDANLAATNATTAIADGYDKNGYNSDGYNCHGHDEDGYDEDGYNEDGYNEDGYNVNGYNSDGYNRHGYNCHGYNCHGHDEDGYNEDGYNENGYDKDGYDEDGYDEDGYNEDGYNEDGYNENGAYRLADYHTVARGYRRTTQLVYGIELELKAKTLTDVESIAKSATKLGWIAERDSSLDDTLGIEIIAPPLSIAENSQRWPAFVSATSTQAKGWDAGTNYGMHISINRLTLSRLHQAKLVVFCNAQKALSERVAGRKECEWAKYKVKNIIARKNTDEKYEALAIRSETRMEHRIYRSTLKPTGVLRNLEFTASCVEFTRNAGLTMLNTVSYETWLQEPRNAQEHKHLIAHLYPEAATKTAERKINYTKNHVPSNS